MKRSKTSSASSGPGEPSGWYWTVSTGRLRCRSPSTEPSLRLRWLTSKPPSRGSVSPTTSTSWFWAVICTRPVCRSLTGWLAPWWPKRKRRVSAPAARPTIWWPRQMPSRGRPSAMAARASRDRPIEARRVARPGRQDQAGACRRQGRSRPCAVCGSTRTRAPRAARLADDILLQPEVDDGDQRPLDGPTSYGSTIDTGRRNPGSSQRVTARGRDSPRRDPSLPVRRSRRAARRFRAAPAQARGCRVRRSPGTPGGAAASTNWRAGSSTAAVAWPTTRPRSHGGPIGRPGRGGRSCR